jgi:hypothetical protein
MGNLDSCRIWQCMLCPCKLRNNFFIYFWNRTILLCISCIYISYPTESRLRAFSDKFTAVPWVLLRVESLCAILPPSFPLWSKFYRRFSPVILSHTLSICQTSRRHNLHIYRRHNFECKKKNVMQFVSNGIISKMKALFLHSPNHSPSIFRVNCGLLPVTVAERSKACTVFARSETGNVGMNV